MHHKYGISPSAKHYTCAVDMLARAGRIDDAVILASQVDDSGHYGLMLWSVLVSAARMKGRLHGWRRRASKWLSLIEVKDLIFVFYAGNIVACPRKEEVLAMLRELEDKIAAEMGYKRSLSSFREFDNDGLEEEELIAGVHSEMLAMEFGILSFLKDGGKIRITKNLWMCGECHLVFKAVSKMERKELVVRDLNIFHHFKDGICSGRDY